MNYGCGQGEFFLHAVRKFERELLLLVRQIHHGEQLIATFAHRVARQQIHAADESEVFARRQVVEERQVLRHHADAAFYFQRAPRIARVLAEDADATRRWRQQAGEHLDGGGFARAIGAKETVETAGLDAEVQFIDRAELPEIARQVGGFDGDIHGAGNGPETIGRRRLEQS